ncbi:Flagellar motor switch protein FliN [Rosistilla carotiformis]|uniref:Flagellar motor switch protein FliN n=1 Tax=Rosistilla carotiformis TaxID=2528017 RepID=A0A518JUX2_9BACT|nr:FliM/FliN family flagellar motor switch protein [Rosistilla carotiformis]QDV69351.1 Flagellar motor switch protein FliN [Rosistilla carotiformis]
MRTANPSFQRRVLGIETEVSVVLATKKIPLEDVLNLTTGAMLTFEKVYDEPLNLMIGKELIASGEVVKLGDKFGLRVRDLAYESNHSDD